MTDDVASAPRTKSNPPGRSDLPKNLHWLCAREGSVSDVCRRLGVNRQQFARYLSGGAKPSARTLWRLCRYFDVEEDVILAPHAEFRRRAAPSRSASIDADPLGQAFALPPRAARNVLGRYHAHFISPSYPNLATRTFVEIFEQDRRLFSRSLDRIREPRTGTIGRARYIGRVAVHGDTVFLVERGRDENRDISETIVAPVERRRSKWYAGSLLAFSWRTRTPYTSRCVWKRLAPTVSLRDALNACGTLPLTTAALDDVIAEVLLGQSGDASPRR